MNGDSIPAGQSKADVIARVVDGLRTLGEYAKGSGVGIIIESHGDFTDSPTLLELLKRAGMDNVALLWDAHHTFVAGKEPPGTTWTALGSFVRHTHLKDSRPEGADVRYVLTGTGTVPVREIVRVLKTGGYKGYYGFEWEKGWHPEIEEPEIAFPHFAARMREYLADGWWRRTPSILTGPTREGWCTASATSGARCSSCARGQNRTTG